MSIKYKFLVLTLVPILCVTLLGAGLSIWVSTTEHEKQARREMAGHLEQLADELDRFGADLLKVLESTEGDQEFNTTVRSLHSLGDDVVKLRRDVTCQLMRFLERRLGPTRGDAAALYDAGGLVGFAFPGQYGVRAGGRAGERPILLVPTADSDLLDCTSKNWKEAEIPEVFSTSMDAPERPSVRLRVLRRVLVAEGVAPVRHVTFSMSTFKEEESVIGALMLRRKVLPEYVKEIARQAAKDLYVFSPEGDLVLASGPFAMEGGLDFIGRARDAEVLVERTFGGEPCTLMLRPYRQGGGTVAILASRVSRGVVEREISRTVWLHMGGLALGLVVAVVVALGSGRFISKPLARISGEMKEIARTRDLDRRVTVRSRDEIGELSISFNDMVRQLKDASEAVEAYREHLEELVARRTGQLQEKMAELESANRRVVESIQYARTIQKAILPTEQNIASRVPDHFVIWHPKDVIGGDIFWFNGEDRGFLFAVIDCTGHGVPGAVMTMIASTTLNRVVHEVGVTDPARILEGLNRLVRGTLSRDSGEPFSDDGLDIGLCFIDATRTFLTFAGARISLFHTRGGEVHELRGDRHSVGYASSDPDHVFINHTIAVDSSMNFYMATDGIQDQVGGDKHLPFGKRRFKRLLTEHHGKPFMLQRELLLRAFGEYKGDEVQRDDVTVVGFTV